jgi:PAS domain S-box-containing protein
VVTPPNDQGFFSGRRHNDSSSDRHSRKVGTMSLTVRLRGFSRRNEYLALPLVVWLVVMAGLAGGVVWAQKRSERSIRQSFETRAKIGADFVASDVADLLARTRIQGEQALSGPKVGQQRLREVSTPFGYTAVLVLDRHGRLLQAIPSSPTLIGTVMTGRYEHLAVTVQQGVPAVSRVVLSAAKRVPVVAFAVPFDTPQGRRVFSGALEVQNSPLRSSLAQVVVLAAGQAYLVDPDGKIVAGEQPHLTGVDVLFTALGQHESGTYRDAQGKIWFYYAQKVSGTPWRLVAAAPTAQLYLPSRDPGVWRMVVVLTVGLAGLIAVAGLARGRRHRRLLREVQQRYRDVFASSLIGMAVIAPDQRLIGVNPAFCTMLGYSEEELLARSVSDITHLDDLGKATAGITEALAGRSQGFSAEKRCLHADGRTVDTLVTTVLVRDEAGTPVHFATQIMDVTERKALEAAQENGNEQLREAHRRVEDLVATLSHDVRQPLGVITGYISTLIEHWDDLDDARRQDFLTRVSGAAQRMSNLVEDILALTNLDAGVIEPRRDTVDVGHALGEVIALLPPEHAGLLSVRYPDRPVHAVVDPGHLQQILLNLIGNAAKYGSGPIEVSLIQDADRLEVTVADHGEGVPEEFVPHLFERFARATTGTAVTKKGSGLGLYIVQQLAEANHGVVLYTRNQPSGSRFTLRLTTAEPSANRRLTAATSGS